MTVGWLAGTVRVDDGPSYGWGVVKDLGGPATLSPGNRHYGAGVRADDWSWQVLWRGLGGAAGTVYIEVRQGHFEERGETAGLDLARRMLGRLRPSRLDLAGDCDGTADRPSALWQLRASAWTRTQRAGWELTLRGDGGEKLTVGSRSSDRYLRVYVKGDRIRHELELKGAVARATGAELVAGARPGGLFEREYGRLVRWR